MADIITAILVVSGILFFALGTYVLVRNPFHRTTRTFFLLTTGLGIACHLKVLIDHTWDDGLALLALRIFIFASLMSLGSFFLMSQDLPTRRNAQMDGRGRTFFLVILILLATTLSLVADGVISKQPGFIVRWGPGTTAYVLVCAGLAASSALEMFRARNASTDRGFRSQSVLLAVGAIILVVAVGSALLGDAQGGPGPLAAIGFLSVGGLLVYLVIAYTLFQIPPVKGTDLMSDRAARPLARPGSTILFEGKGSRPAFDTMIEELPFGEKGLIITRLHPDQVKERYTIDNARIFWLCGQPGEGRIDPLSLTILQNIIIEHMQKHGRSIILLDGVEYLIAENNVDKVLRLLYSVRDSVVISGSRLLVPLDPQALGARELALIEKEFVVIGEPSE